MSKEPQANRGDHYTLTAATFTVLTGFTRASPTGLGHPYDSPRPGHEQTGEMGRLPALFVAFRGSVDRIVGPCDGRAHPGRLGPSERVLSVEGPLYVANPGTSSIRIPDRHEIEAKLGPDARVGMDPGFGGASDTPSLRARQRLGRVLGSL